MPEPPDDVRKKCGDVLLVGGTFFLKGKLVFDKIEFPVDVHLKIGRKGLSFPKVTPIKREAPNA